MPDSVTKDPVSGVQYPPSIVEDVNKLVQRVQTFTGATGAAIALREGLEMVCRASRGNNAPDVGMVLSLDGTFTGLAVTGMKAVRCDDTENDSRVDPEISRALRIKSMAVVPVLSGMKVTGVIAVFSGQGNAFSDTHMAVLKTMADGLGAVIQRWLEGPGATMTPAPPAQPKTEVSRPAAPPPQTKFEPAARMEEAKPVLVQAPRPMSAPAAAATAPALDKVPETKQPPKKESQGKWKPVVAPKQDEESAPVLVKPAAKPEPKTEPRPEPMFAAPVFVTESSSEREGMRNPMVLGGVAAVVLFAAIGGYFMFGHSNAKSVAPTTAAAAQPAPASTTPTPAAVTPGTTPSTTTPASTAAAAKLDPSKPVDKSLKPTQIADTTRSLATPAAMTVKAPAAASSQASAEVAPPSITLAANTAGPALDIPMTTSAPRLSAPAPVNAVVVPSKLLQRVNPSYPAAAKQYRVEGAVTLSATIGADGHVHEAKVISGPPMLRDSAVNAVRQWKYAPSTVNGRSVESTVQIVLQFKMPS